MATAYAILYRGAGTRAGQTVVRQIVWHEDEAIAVTSRLNALGTAKTPEPYSWQPVWIARRDPRADVSLTPEDRDYLDLAQKLGVLDTERPIGVFFSFVFNLPGAREARADLELRGWSDTGIVEERDDGECWHLYGHDRRLILNAKTITQLRAEMEDLAERCAGTFDGWDVSGGKGLHWAKPGELPH